MFGDWRTGADSRTLYELPAPVRERIFEDLGAASACWSNLNGAGEFQSQAAARIGSQLCIYLSGVIGEEIARAVKEARESGLGQQGRHEP
jgi:hypothetical protein